MRFFIQVCNNMVVNCWEQENYALSTFSVWNNVSPTIYQAAIHACDTLDCIDIMKRVCFAIENKSIVEADLFIGDNVVRSLRPDFVEFAKKFPRPSKTVGWSPTK